MDEDIRGVLWCVVLGAVGMLLCATGDIALLGVGTIMFTACVLSLVWKIMRKPWTWEGLR